MSALALSGGHVQAGAEPATWEVTFRTAEHEHLFELTAEEGVASPTVYHHWAFLPNDPRAHDDDDEYIQVDWSRSDQVIEELLARSRRAGC